MVTAQSTIIEPFSFQDLQSFQVFWRKELWNYLRKYILLFLLLVLAYYFAIPSITSKFRNLNPAHFQLAVVIFFSLFAISFLGFSLKDYYSWLRPVRQDLKQEKKYCISFAAQKYYDPIFKCCLLFYPGVEDQYICIDVESFEKIEDGELLYMEMSAVTETIMLLKSDSVKVNKAAKFRFR